MSLRSSGTPASSAVSGVKECSAPDITLSKFAALLNDTPKMVHRSSTSGTNHKKPINKGKKRYTYSNKQVVHKWRIKYKVVQKGTLWKNTKTYAKL